MTTWKPILPFDNDAPEFALGVEVGILHERLKNEPLPIVATAHAVNIEMLMRLAEERGCSVACENDDSEWLFVRFY